MIEFEQGFFGYRQGIFWNDADISGFWLKFIRKKCQQLLKGQGKPWNDEAENALQKTLQTYDPNRGKFVSAFLDNFRDRAIKAEDSAYYRGTGFGVWERTRSSVQERILVNRDDIRQY